VFARHLPPSAGLPRVLALDGPAAAELATLAEVTQAASPAVWPAGPFDAIAGPAAPEHLAALNQRLRPGGRLILTHTAAPETLLAALTAAGLIHCLVEPQPATTLYRGERPPTGSPVERHQILVNPQLPGTDYHLPITNYDDLKTPYVFLLIQQTPNKPAWKLAPGEPVTWQAATVLPAATESAVLLGFSALVKAVAYMQSAVKAGRHVGVNKVGKFPAAAMLGWPLPLALNPSFEQVAALEPGPWLAVEAHSALTGEE
jgi:hypothetical protein